MAVIHEAATDVIAQEQAKGCDAPWEDPEFIDQVTLMQKERQMGHCEHSEAIQQNNAGSPRLKPRDDVQFYDRSPFCTYALGKYLSHWKGIEFKPSPVLLSEIDYKLQIAGDMVQEGY